MYNVLYFLLLLSCIKKLIVKPKPERNGKDQNHSRNPEH